MSTLTDALDGVVDALTAAGIAATTNPADIVVPGAWVIPHDITEPTLCGGLTVRADVCLVAPDNGTANAIAILGDLLDQAAPVLTFDEPVRSMAVTPPGLSALPALVITTTTD
ncbi:hypothetical protein [Gordonia sp. MMO-8]|uniref:hypothetical protein n=1 Tax=Gordonia sp. MMO-8 TaxID=3127886 RepID=UPI00301A7784